MTQLALGTMRESCYNSRYPNRVGRAALAMPPTLDTTKARFVMPGDPTPNPDAAQAKTCTKCGETKALDQYYKRPGGRMHTSCRSCWSAKNRAQYIARRDELLPRAVARGAANREAKREYDRTRYPVIESQKRAYNTNHYCEHRDRFVIYARQYRQRISSWSPPDWCSLPPVRWRYRRPAAGAAHPLYSTERLIARWQYYGGMCWMCHGPADTIDHVIPLARGGSNIPANLRPACLRCNSRKGAS